MTRQGEAYGSIPAWVRVGVKCVCVDDAVTPGAIRYNAAPPKGHIVTISALVASDPYGRGPGVAIAGYPNVVPLHGEVGWRVNRFRPAVPPKSEAEDLAQFLPFLKPQKAMEPV